MAKAIFLFHGGHYKRGLDDHRLRVPLEKPELDMVFYDPEVPNDTDNSIGTELNMARWADALCDLEVDDEIFIGLAPDAALYRGLWAMSFNAVPGFTVDIDLVVGEDVYDSFVGGGADPGTGVAAFNPAPLAYDFANGLGDATCDAVTKAGLPWGSGDYADYRNDDALVFLPFDPVLFAGLGKALYFRMTVTALGQLGTGEPSCCSNCANPKWPIIQVGATYDRLCVDKQRVQRFCNCTDPGLCGTCEDGPGTAP